MMRNINQPCPCQNAEQSPKTYSQCCQPLHLGTKTAVTPEQLMRSRYAAFSLGDAQYLDKTHHASQRSTDNTTLATSLANTQWHGLIITSTKSGHKPTEGYVEFIARYSENQQPGLLHEKSRFVKENEQWFYIDGEIVASGPTKLPSRNEPCWCNSGNKFKKCHG